MEGLRSYSSSPTLSESASNELRISDELRIYDGKSQHGSFLWQGNAPTYKRVLSDVQTTIANASDAQFVGLMTDGNPAPRKIVRPPASKDDNAALYSLEDRADLLFSTRHLQAILDRSKSFLAFSEFLTVNRPQSMCNLTQYLDAHKALRAISYANALVQNLALEIHGKHAFEKVLPTRNRRLTKTVERLFQTLANDDLPAYITHVWSRVVSDSIHRRITRSPTAHSEHASHCLAEVFCLTDPTRRDNPIVLVSEQFSKTTQYSTRESIGRNCRFLQGPRSKSASIQRLAVACEIYKEHSEIIVNYRRDGSPFLNFLTIAPLLDELGEVRYFIGAQVDVSGLLKDCSEFEGLAKLIGQDEKSREKVQVDGPNCVQKLRDLCQMFNTAEAAMVRMDAGRMYREYIDELSDNGFERDRKRVLLKDESHANQDAHEHSIAGDAASSVKTTADGKLGGVFRQV